MQDGFKPQCSGLGVIDCAGECAGTEDEFKHFMDVMEDKEFDQKFPELAKVKKSQEKVKPAAEDKMEDVPSEGEEMEEEEEKDSVKTKFMNGLMKCANFSQETMALLSLANPGAGGGEVWCAYRFQASFRYWRPGHVRPKQQGVCQPRCPFGDQRSGI